MLEAVSLNLLPAMMRTTMVIKGGGLEGQCRKECCPIFIKSCPRGHLVNMSCDMFILNVQVQTFRFSFQCRQQPQHLSLSFPLYEK